MSVVNLDQVHFRYRQKPVLEDTTLAVNTGDLMCLVGPNGAGKTTALKLMAGILAPQAGQVTTLEVDPAAQNRQHLATRMAFLPQQYRQVFPFSAVEIVLMGRYAHRPRSLFDVDERADMEAAERAMNAMGIVDLAERRFDELSGGEQRRVLLAQALCQDAELILLDEPTSALDPEHAISFFQALRVQCAAGRTAVCVTHDLGLAARFADRIAVIGDRKVLVEAKPKPAFANPATSKAFNVVMHLSELPDGSLSVVALSKGPSQ